MTDEPFFFVPGVSLDPALAPKHVSIKGSRPQLQYSTELLQMYPDVPTLDTSSVYDRIRAELSRAAQVMKAALPIARPVMLPTVGRNAIPQMLMCLLDPRLARLELHGRSAAGDHAIGPALDDVKPFPLRLASPSKLLHTLAWADANLKLAVERIAHPFHLADNHVHELALIALRLYCYIAKHDDRRLASSMNFNHSMFIQDRIVQLLFGDDLYWTCEALRVRPHIANEMALAVLKEYQCTDARALCSLAVFMGVLWMSREDVQAAFVENSELVVGDFCSRLEAIRNDWSIDERSAFMSDVENTAVKEVVVVLDDNGESVVDLALVQQLLRDRRSLRISLIVNRYPVSTNLSASVLERVLTWEFFDDLAAGRAARRVRILMEEQLLPSFELAYCAPETRHALETCDFAYIKGVNFFETFQPTMVGRYYAFVVSGRMSALLSGCREGSGIFTYVPPQQVGYMYRSESDVDTLEARRRRWQGR